MFVKQFFLLLVSFSLAFSIPLKSTYETDDKQVTVSDIIPHAKNDALLYTIHKHKSMKRVSAKDLVKKLDALGYEGFSAKSNYVRFLHKSPIDLTPLKEQLKAYYKEHYEQIEIKELIIYTRAYVDSLPESFTIKPNKRAFLYDKGIFHIKTPDKKKIFFDYLIEADLEVYITREDVKKKMPLSAMSTKKKKVRLEMFRSPPLQSYVQNAYEFKHHMKQGKVITQRDLLPLSLVRRGSNVNVKLLSTGMSIEFSAKALQDGKLHDIITVLKSDGKRLKVKVIGKNRAEVQ